MRNWPVASTVADATSAPPGSPASSGTRTVTTAPVGSSSPTTVPLMEPGMPPRRTSMPVTSSPAATSTSVASSWVRASGYQISTKPAPRKRSL